VGRASRRKRERKLSDSKTLMDTVTVTAKNPGNVVFDEPPRPDSVLMPLDAFEQFKDALLRMLQPKPRPPTPTQAELRREIFQALAIGEVRAITRERHSGNSYADFEVYEYRSEHATLLPKIVYNRDVGTRRRLQAEAKMLMDRLVEIDAELERL
jgi:hypothetical protein